VTLFHEIVALFFTLTKTFVLRITRIQIRIDRHSFLKLDPDPDPHSPKKLDPYPDPHTVNADLDLFWRLGPCVSVKMGQICQNVARQR
jgi:hypothetical protein